MYQKSSTLPERDVKVANEVAEEDATVASRSRDCSLSRARSLDARR
jgi:hypothetical protein